MDKFAKVDKNILIKNQGRKSSDINRAVKDVRDFLAYGNQTESNFERELILTYAHTQQSTLILSIMLVYFTTACLVYTLGIAPAAIWACLQFLAYYIQLRLARKCLESDASNRDHKAWFYRFCLSNFVVGTCWSSSIAYSWLYSEQSYTLPIMFGLTFVYVVKTMQAGYMMRLAPLLNTLPPSLILCAQLATEGTFTNLILAILMPAALVFVTAIVAKLRDSLMRDMKQEAEKDGMIADLETARIMSETARRQAEEANLAKSRFLAAMSHELRTPLNAILGFSEVMSNEMLGPLENQNYKDYSKDIHSSGSHLLELINEILDLSRIEAGKYELREEIFLLKDIAHDAMHMVELRANAKDISLTCEITADLPKVFADEKAIRQIMLNLLSNAVKFTQKGGAVVFKLGWTQSGGQYFSVTDNGPGIPEDEISVVLSPFGQGSIAIHSAEAGSGLGLPIVKAMVDLHQGKFDLSSKLREGTVVTIMLPANRVMSSLPAINETENQDEYLKKRNNFVGIQQTPLSETPMPSRQKEMPKSQVFGK